MCTHTHTYICIYTDIHISIYTHTYTKHTYICTHTCTKTYMYTFYIQTHIYKNINSLTNNIYAHICIRLCISDAAVLLAGAVAGDVKHVLIDEFTSLLDRRTAAVRQYLYFCTSKAVQKYKYSRGFCRSGALHFTTQFTCFASTKVQIMTTEELQDLSISMAAYIVKRNVAGVVSPYDI
jgi:hypothetical protein